MLELFLLFKMDSNLVFDSVLLNNTNLSDHLIYEFSVTIRGVEQICFW